MKTLEASDALSAGADIWVLPKLEQSGWAKRIDWALGFQITRAEPHVAATASAELETLLDEVEFAMGPVRTQPGSPLMVVSQGQLPARAAVRIEAMTGQPQAWVKRVRVVWDEMGRPSLRVFLPRGVSTADFSKSWGEAGSEIQLVADAELDLNAWT